MKPIFKRAVEGSREAALMFEHVFLFPDVEKCPILGNACYTGTHL